MQDNSLLQYQIALTLINGVGNVLAKNLVFYVGSVEGIFKQKQTQLEKIPGIGEHTARQIVSADVMKQAEVEAEFVLKHRIRPLFYTDRDYSYRLKECPDSPVLIYQKGDADLNRNQFIGVVGTRNATDYGKELCNELIKQLASRHPELVVVSGLAYGIDICAHKAALANELTTIGVLGHGLDKIYPATHRSVAVKMTENGGLLTEYPSGTKPDRQNFVQRNRIIAGLVDAVVVVESAERGGSLITALCANDYNRDVCTFPGRVGDMHSAGCNRLIKSNKANLIENAEDLEYLMNWQQKENRKDAPQLVLFASLTDEEKRIFETIRRNQPADVNQLAKTLEMPMGALSPLLIEMEFKNAIQCLPGNRYRCR